MYKNDRVTRRYGEPFKLKILMNMEIIVFKNIILKVQI